MLELYNDALLDLFVKGGGNPEKLDIKKDKKGEIEKIQLWNFYGFRWKLCYSYLLELLIKTCNNNIRYGVYTERSD